MAVTRSQSAAGAPLRRMMNEIDRLRRGRRWIKRYKPTDVAHRHRLRDRQPKSVNVSGYNRRN